MGVNLSSVAPLPWGVAVEGPTMRGPNTAEARIQWQPTAGQLGVHILCVEAADHYGTNSPPTCFVVMVAREFIEVC